MKGKSIFLALILALGACGNSDSRGDDCTSDECQKQRAYDKVIAVHDEVMPKLSQVSELKEKIEEKMQNSSDSTQINSYLLLMQNLDAADKAMWTWMRAFDSDIETWPLDSALHYLATEQKKIEQVAEQINTSLDEANKVIK